MIIDTNAKLGRKTRTKCTYLETLLKSMDNSGIAMSVISSYPQFIDNEEILNALQMNPKRLIAFYMANPWLNNRDDFLHYLHEGFTGLVLDPIAHGYALDDQDLLDPLLSICETFYLPVWLNTFSSFFTVCSLAEELARTYPHASFILGHMGFNYDATTACELAKEYSNIFLETSASMAINLERAKKSCGAKKLLLGSGYPDINFQELAIENLKDVFDENELALILGHNFEDLMKKVKICELTC